MSRKIRIELQPINASFSIEEGAPLQDALFSHGVEFPCGGRGRCKGCRVRVLKGSLEATAEQKKILSLRELEDGWRLSCQSRATEPITIEIAQWEAAILADHSHFDFTPREGLGVAIDLGTTTLVAQLLDLQTAEVLAVRSALNPQARHGADVMSRVEFAVARGGQGELTRLIRERIGGLVLELAEVARVPTGGVRQVVIVGNTVMHHLFCGESLEPLSRYPFETPAGGARQFRSDDLGWRGLGDSAIHFLPCLGGFVGSDILAGILATRLHESEELVGLVDLGTNGEIVIGNRKRMVCASTAAGPAFEGARISMGMRASTGAISEVRADGGTLRCHVIGGGVARGICGSGLVDAAASALDLGLLRENGRLAGGRDALPLRDSVTLTQTDIRELQLAKGAIAAGIRIVLKQFGVDASALKRLYLAGAFGNYLNLASARRIGLINLPGERIQPAGNSALLGAKLALFSADDDRGFRQIRERVAHRPPSEDASFQDLYVEHMGFPAASP